jgi:septum formation protein
MTLVLASASPARRATLIAAGLAPLVVVSTVDEEAVVAHYGVVAAEDIVLVLARAKAEDVADREDLPPGALVLGCDSVLDLDGAVHGKPADADQARARWRTMSGRSGVLHTGHWLIDTGSGGGTLGAVASTVVHFARLSEAEIDAYVATGEPLQVAGAFTIDGLGAAFVRGVEGDHHSVVGVSVPLLRELAGDLGVPWPSLWRSAGR